MLVNLINGKTVTINSCTLRVEVKRENTHSKFHNPEMNYFYQVVARGSASGIDVVLKIFATRAEAFDYYDHFLEDLEEENQTGVGSILFPDQPGGDSCAG